jgi:hypothetical protein
VYATKNAEAMDGTGILRVGCDEREGRSARRDVVGHELHEVGVERRTGLAAIPGVTAEDLAQPRPFVGRHDRDTAASLHSRPMSP